MAISCCDHSLTEQQLVQLFTTGLGDPLHTDVALRRLATLDEAIMPARAYEQRLSSPILSPFPSLHVDEIGRFGCTSSVNQDADYQAVVYDRNCRPSDEGYLLQMR
jgi:hypothetical protein